MKLIDVHAHIQQHAPEELEGILSRAEEAGVGAIITAGVTLDDSVRCVELAGQHPMLFAGVGVHPTDLSGLLTVDDLARLDEMASRDGVVVMSEVGIDHQPHVLARPTESGRPWVDVQDEAFRQQIEIAKRQLLPVVFHVREPGDDLDAASAWPVALRIIAETSAGANGGAAHYFQGDIATAGAVLDAGFMVSFARPLLRLKKLQEVAAWLPMERIVLETDSYPQPFKKNRMKWTEPRHLLSVAECLSEVRGISIEEVAERTSENALNMLGAHGDQVRMLLV